MESIAGLQLLLYGLAWSVAAWLVPEERRALLHWAAYALVQAVSALLAAPALAAGQAPPAVALMLATLGMAAAARGVDTFLFGRCRYDRWALAIVVPSLLAIALVDQVVTDPGEHRRWLGEPYSVGLALLMLSYGVLTFGPLRRQHGWPAATLVTAPMMVMGLFAILSAVSRLRLDPQALAAMQSATRTSNIAMSLVMSAIFNFGYVFLLMSRLLRRLRESSRTDHLTGLQNRRAIEASLEAAWQQSRRTGCGLAVAMLDLDHFKRINDEQGHAAGDRALAWAAATLQERLRTYDSVGRWGGEEFLVVMLGTPAEPAQQTGERLRLALAEQSAAGSGVAFTVSIGLAVQRDDDASAEVLVQRADRALYRAKQQGRDCVVVD